jgi:hypothetical protein
MELTWTMIIIVVLGDRDALDNDELLFQVTSDGLFLLFLPCEAGGALARPCLIQGLACSSHGGNESLLLGHDAVLLSLGGGGLFPIDGGEVGVAARHGRQHGGDGQR